MFTRTGARPPRALACQRQCATLVTVSSDEAYFQRFGFAARHIPELDRERGEVSRYKGVFAKDQRQRGTTYVAISSWRAAR